MAAEKIVALLTKHAGRLPVDDGALQVVQREAGRFPIGRGWSYRFQSHGEWLLVPLEEAAAFVFAGEPGGSAR